MVLDSEEQKKMLLDMVNAITFKGEAVEAVFCLKKAIKEAVVSIAKEETK